MMLPSSRSAPREQPGSSCSNPSPNPTLTLTQRALTVAKSTESTEHAARSPPALPTRRAVVSCELNCWYACSPSLRVEVAWRAADATDADDADDAAALAPSHAENNVRRMISALLRSEKLQYILIGSEYSETSKRYPH